MGMIETAVHTCLPDVMKAVATHRPGILLELEVELTLKLAERLMLREVDLIMQVGAESENPYVVTEDHRIQQQVDVAGRQATAAPSE